MQVLISHEMFRVWPMGALIEEGKNFRALWVLPSNRKEMVEAKCMFCFKKMDGLQLPPKSLLFPLGVPLSLPLPGPDEMQVAGVSHMGYPWVPGGQWWARAGAAWPQTSSGNQQAAGGAEQCVLGYISGV